MIELTKKIEEAAQQLQKAIGLPICQVTVHFSDDGKVQNVQPQMVIKRLQKSSQSV